MDRLTAALDRHTTEIETALTAAREERDQLRARERELTEMIERAESALGGGSGGSRMTLHEAIVKVLEDGGNEWTHTREIADEVNRRDLYRKRDGSPVESNQIHARAKNYLHLFEKEGPLVRLRTSHETAPTEPSRSKYDALRDWLATAEQDTVTLSFEEIDELVGSLPQSAWDHQAWWANEKSGSHVQARSWREAGFRTAYIDQRGGWVRFERENGDDGPPGVRETIHPTPSGPEDEITAEGTLS